MRIALELPSNKITRSRNVAVWFVDKHEVLVHPLGIHGSLEHEQVLRSDQTMLHSGLKMKPIARSERLDCQRLTGGTPIQDEPCALLHFQVFVLLLVHLKSEVSTLTNDEIFFDARVIMENDDYASPRSLDDPVAIPLDAVEKFRKKRGCSNGPVSEVLPPEQACLATIAIERLLGVDGDWVLRLLAMVANLESAASLL